MTSGTEPTLAAEARARAEAERHQLRYSDKKRLEGGDYLGLFLALKKRVRTYQLLAVAFFVWRLVQTTLIIYLETREDQVWWRTWLTSWWQVIVLILVGTLAIHFTRAVRRCSDVLDDLRRATPSSTGA